ncbi:MAG: hypothetical protein Q8N16_03035 [bacterium]|nr:hypothetical protein [bacterium]
MTESPQNYKRNQKLWILIGLCFFIFSIFLISFSFKDLGNFLFPPEKPFSVDNVFREIKKEFHKSTSEYPMMVGDKVVSWQELDQVLEFEEMLWKNRPINWQIKALISKKGYEYEKEEIVNLLLKRKIIEQIVKSYAILDLTDNEIEKAKIDSFSQNYKELPFSSHLEMEARARTRAFKEKIDKELVQRYTGILVYVKFESAGAFNLKNRGINPKVKAKEKIDELYQEAKRGVETISLAALANNDSGIIELNDRAQAIILDESALIDLSLSSPEIKEVIKSLSSDQVSEIFELSAILDPNSNEHRPFAYGFLKIDRVSGSAESLESLIQQTKDNLKIEININ